MKTHHDYPPLEDLKTNKRILYAAATLFTVQGMKGTSMQEIADEAGISKGLIYHYYRSKEEVYRFILEEGRERFHQVVAEVGLKTNPMDRLSSVVSSHLALFSDPDPILKLFCRELIQIETGTGESPAGQFLRCCERTQEIITSGIQEGQIRPVDPAMASLSIMGMVYFHGLEMLKNPGEGEKERIQHLLEMIRLSLSISL